MDVGGSRSIPTHQGGNARQRGDANRRSSVACLAAYFAAWLHGSMAIALVALSPLLPLVRCACSVDAVLSPYTSRALIACLLRC